MDSPGCARPVGLALVNSIGHIWKLFDDELEAVHSFFPDRAVKPFDILSVIQYQDNRNSDLGIPFAGTC